MDSGNQSWRPPYKNVPGKSRVKFMQDSPFFKVVFSITFILAFVFFIISIFVLFSPANSGHFFEASPVYFFVLLLNTPIYPVSTIWVATGMMVLYSIFFGAMLYLAYTRPSRRIVDNPVFFYGGIASLSYFLAILITVIEMAMGVQIGGSSIETGIKNYPYLTFIQLIYAPFAEEFGFRILPLGLLSTFIVLRARGLGTTRKDAAMAFLIPGIIRGKYGLKLTKWDYILVTATSILFGLAHFLSGAWDPGKIISAAMVGFFLAFSFLKFGVFMDIPMHWFYNGFSSLYVIYPPVTFPWYFSVLWIMLSGISAFVFVLFMLAERKKRSWYDSGFPPDPLS